MSNLKCPNCNQFKYKKGWSNRGCGWVLLIGVPIFVLMMPGMSGFYGGSVSGGGGGIVFVSMIIGLIVIVSSYLSPQKTINYKCSNCDFEQKHKM